MKKAFGLRLLHAVLFALCTSRSTSLLLISLFLFQCLSEKSNETHKTIRIDHIVDLTHTLTRDFPFIPVKKLTYPFDLVPMATLEKNGVAANSWRIHEHLGTHIDAPNHFILDQLSVDQIPLADLIVPLVIINVEVNASVNEDLQLLVADIEKYEREFGRIPENSCVIMYSGWDKKIGSPEFIGLDSNMVKHFPGFSNEAIRFLIDERRIAGIGADVLSFDPGVDENYSGHKILFGKGKWGVENVANLGTVPESGATIIVGAPKVGGGTGGLSRLIAVW